MEKITYLGFKNCFRIANKEWEVIVTTEVGPRVISYGRVYGSNQLGEFPNLSSNTDYGVWKPYGGHRLWVAPESMPFSYAPDNESVEALVEGDLSIRLVQKPDSAGMGKELRVTLDPVTSQLQIGHKLTNHSGETKELAIWAITIFKGGEAFVPLERQRTHEEALLPAQLLVLWPFTNMADPRATLGDGWLRLKTDANHKVPIKFGLGNKRRWAAYYGGEDLFIKRFNYCEGATYPDFGSNCEVYADGEYLEVETLAPLKKMRDEDTMEHMETWELHSVGEEGPMPLLETQARLA
jgi:hypothetical protein